MIGTSPHPGYSWVFIKVITSEPGLYGLGSANYRYLSWAVKAVNMFFVEDIQPPEQIDHFARISTSTTTPMAMGELFTHPHEGIVRVPRP